MSQSELANKGAPGVPYYTPAQEPPAGTALNPASAPKVFQPIKIRSLELHNRFVVAPMCQYSADDGHLTDYHLVHLGQFALRGPSLIIIEATAVEARGRITPQDSGLWQDSQIAPLKRIVDFLHSQNIKVGIQLAHAGRKASTLAPWLGGTVTKTLAGESVGGWPDDVVAPSAIQWSEGYAVPKELTVEEIQGLVKGFADAAVRSLEAGIDVVEIHGAHGYLINSFLSPISNQRTDQYGGSFENRSRFLKEVIAAVRAVIPADAPLWVRVSGTEWMDWTNEPSWTVDDTIALAKLLPELGVDVLDVSSGGNNSAQRIPPVKTPHLDFTRKIYAALREVKSPLLVGTVGGYTTTEEAATLLEDGKVLSADTPDAIEVQGDGHPPAGDLLLAARQYLREPEWVLRTAFELGIEVAWPHQYHRAGWRRAKLA